jgi:TolA-binding protein
MKLRHILPLLVLGLFFTSCAPARSNITEQRIARIENDIREMRGLLAETRATQISIEREVRTIQGSLETVSFHQTQQPDGSEELGAIERRLERLGRRVPPPALVPIVQLEEDESFALALQDQRLQRDWINMFTRLREGNYQGALEQLSTLSLASESPEAQMRVLFWSAVCYEGLGRANEAVTAYHRIGSDFADSPRAPVALLRLASVFIRLRDFDSAKLTLESIRLRYSGTPEAQRAAERLKDLR